MQAQEAGAPQPAPSLPATHGLLDCGATASACPQWVSAILAKDSKAMIQVRKGDRPHFRFGNGKWGRALYRVSRTNLSTTKPFGHA